MMRRIINLFDEHQSKENSKHTSRAMKENAWQGELRKHLKTSKDTQQEHINQLNRQHHLYEAIETGS